ncbi:2OG-Fe(II) oxygenase, partial [Pseudomonas sp. SIMBA_021]
MRAMHISPEHPMLAAVVDDLATHGWSRQALFLPGELVRALAAECRRRDAE